MNRVFIASSTFDLDGHLEITPLPDSDYGATTRRVNKVKTLDGGVAVNDGGYSHGDKDFTIRWKPTSSEFEQKAGDLVKNHSTVYVTTADGCFLATPSSYQPSGGESSLTLLIQEKVNQ